MGIVARLRRAVRRSATPSDSPSAPQRRVPAEPMRLRRWDAARSDRLNTAHWGRVTGSTLNSDLQDRLETLRTRCEFEASNNPFVEGVIATHACDVCGRRGPTLQIESDSEEYNEALERLWRNWWGDPEGDDERRLARPDVNGTLYGVEFIQQAIRYLWLSGEFLWQITIDAEAKTPLRTRLRAIDPRRLAVAWGGGTDVLMGVQRTKTGKPVAYYVDTSSDGSGSPIGAAIAPIPATSILHGFIKLEADQVRGVPWLASCLQTIADVRDFDAQVLDAARMAADFAVFLTTTHPDAPFTQVNETTEFERRTIRTAPPGYQATPIQPTQPSTQYKDYRAERLRELGRPVSMPLMMVLLDSSRHNYSSARFDGQLYQRQTSVVQGHLERWALNPLLAAITTEARVARLLPAAPARLRYLWTWPVPPHVDPLKEANAATVRLQNGTSCLQIECATSGYDYEQIQAQRAREGLPPVGLPGLQPSPASGEAAPADTDDEEKDEDRPGNEEATNETA